MKKYLEAFRARKCLPTLFRETIPTPQGLRLDLPLYWKHDINSRFVERLFAIFEGVGAGFGRRMFWRDTGHAERKTLVRQARDLGVRDTRGFLINSTEIIVDTVLVATDPEADRPQVLWRLFSVKTTDGTVIPLYRVNTRLGKHREVLHRVARWPFGEMASNINGLTNRLRNGGVNKSCHPEVFYPTTDDLQLEIELLYENDKQSSYTHYCGADAFDLSVAIELMANHHRSVANTAKLYRSFDVEGGAETDWVLNNPVLLTSSPRRQAALTDQLTRVLQDRQHAEASWALDFHQKLHDWTYATPARSSEFENDRWICTEKDNARTRKAQ